MLNEEKAIEAVKILLEYIGEDVDRDGLAETPARMLRALREMTSGYKEDPLAMMKGFSNHHHYKDMIVLRDVDFISCCEHHMLPIIGKASVAYIPKENIAGISKLARVVDIFAKRLQMQERMTVEIATAIQQSLQPHGVAVCIKARHGCMQMRGVGKLNTSLDTYHYIGQFETDAELRGRFFDMMTKPHANS